MRILLVEDEIAMRDAMVPLLEKKGYRVECAVDGEEGLRMALDGEHHVILLDIMLPKLDGFALCRELRRRGRKVPVLMVTARGELDDRVRGLDEGADDYLVKPFSGRELLARIRALLRRSGEGEDTSIREVTLGEFTVEFEQMSCRGPDGEVALSAREFRILEELAKALGKPVTREEILDRVWEYNSWPTSRTVDNHIVALRAKLEPDPATPRYLLTVYGVGYRLVTGPEDK
jgi:DNA-binding response OmpR family regulator